MMEHWLRKEGAELCSQFLAEYGIAMSYKLSADCAAPLLDYFSSTSYTSHSEYKITLVSTLCDVLM
jgi:hypothetical protein